MGKLSQLLKWKSSVNLVDEEGNPLLDDKGLPIKVYLRIIGDHDLQEAYRLARIASARKRAVLKDTTSDDYFGEVAVIEAATEEQCLEIIKADKNSKWFSESISAVVRPDELTLKDIAIDPDAPSLEEQERLDAENMKQELEYQNEILSYVNTKERELLSQIKNAPLEELRELAKESMMNIIPTSVFLDVMNAQKVYRASFMDEAFKDPAFESFEDWEQTSPIIRDQLVEAYRKLEIRQDELKNS